MLVGSQLTKNTLSLTLSLLNTVIDSLDLRVCKIAAPSEWLKTQIAPWRKYQDESSFDSDPYLVEFPELGSWRLKFSGRKPYEFVLINPNICDVYIWNPDKWESAISTQTGQLYISFRSRYLQIAGIEQVQLLVDKLAALLFSSGSGGFCRVARVDPAVDIQLERGFTWSDLPNFVSRSRYRDVAADSENSPFNAAKQVLENLRSPQGITRGVLPTISPDQIAVLQQALDFASAGDDGYLYRICHNRQPQTLYFGRFGSPVYARIYDKLASLDKQDKGYMRDIWAVGGWDNESPVWRFEFSLSGDFLKEAVDLMNPNDLGELPHDLREFDTFLAALPQIWQYLTQNWLRFTQPSPTDKNLWRSPLSPIWELVQQAFPVAIPIIRLRPPRHLDDEQLLAQLKGVALSLAAKRSACDSLTGAAYSCWFDVWKYFESSSFEPDLKERRRLLGIDDLSDTNFSAEIRSERMIDGSSS